jgi:fucose 4-O-acetylase-like acetyltransferase
MASPSRDPYFDNAKFVLVTLVVVGHAWVMMPDAPGAFPAYHFLNSWHIIAFVIVTGYLSRGVTWSAAHLRSLVTVLLVPYVVFESLMAWFRAVVGGESLGGPLFLDPHWPMWYLIVLAQWRLLTPLLRRLPVAAALGVSVLASLAGGLLETDLLDLNRTLAMLPFFTLGLVMRREHFTALAQPRVRVLGASALAAGYLVAALVAGPTPVEWVYWRSSYETIGVGDLQGLAIRSGQIALATVLSLGALALVPTTRRWFTGLGAASLVVYLCHGFFVKAAQYAGVGALVPRDESTAFVLITLGAVGVSLLLAATPVARRLGVLVDPISTLSTRPGRDLEPHHLRETTVGQLALTPRDPTRRG